MSLFGLFSKRNISSVARDRLQILLAHERSGNGNSELISQLHREILEVIKRHVTVDQDKVQVKLDGGLDGCSVLEIDIEMPQMDKDTRRSA